MEGGRTGIVRTSDADGVIGPEDRSNRADDAQKRGYSAGTLHYDQESGDAPIRRTLTWVCKE